MNYVYASKQVDKEKAYCKILCLKTPLLSFFRTPFIPLSAVGAGRIAGGT